MSANDIVDSDDARDALKKVAAALKLPSLLPRTDDRVTRLQRQMREAKFKTGALSPDKLKLSYLALLSTMDPLLLTRYSKSNWDAFLGMAALVDISVLIMSAADHLKLVPDPAKLPPCDTLVSLLAAANANSGDLSADSLGAFLLSIGLETFKEILNAEGVDSPELLEKLTDADLKELGFKAGHRARLRLAYEKFLPEKTLPKHEILPSPAVATSFNRWVVSSWMDQIQLGDLGRLVILSDLHQQKNANRFPQQLNRIDAWITAVAHLEPAVPPSIVKQGQLLVDEFRLQLDRLDGWNTQKLAAGLESVADPRDAYQKVRASLPPPSTAFTRQDGRRDPTRRPLRGPGVCFWCQKKGHTQEQCFARRRGEPQVLSQPPTSLAQPMVQKNGPGGKT